MKKLMIMVAMVAMMVTALPAKAETYVPQETSFAINYYEEVVSELDWEFGELSEEEDVKSFHKEIDRTAGTAFWSIHKQNGDYIMAEIKDDKLDIFVKEGHSRMGWNGSLKEYYEEEIE